MIIDIKDMFLSFFFFMHQWKKKNISMYSMYFKIYCFCIYNYKKIIYNFYICLSQ